MTTLPCTARPAPAPLYTAAVVLRSTTHGKWWYVRATILVPRQRKADGVWTWRCRGCAPGSADRRSRAKAERDAHAGRLALLDAGDRVHPGTPSTGAEVELVRTDACTSAPTTERCA